MPARFDAWRADYNGVRPHSALANRTPEEFRPDPCLRKYPTRKKPFECAARSKDGARRFLATGPTLPIEFVRKRPKYCILRGRRPSLSPSRRAGLLTRVLIGHMRISSDGRALTDHAGWVRCWRATCCRHAWQDHRHVAGACARFARIGTYLLSRLQRMRCGTEM